MTIEELKQQILDASEENERFEIAYQTLVEFKNEGGGQVAAYKLIADLLFDIYDGNGGSMEVYLEDVADMIWCWGPSSHWVWDRALTDKDLK